MVNKFVKSLGRNMSAEMTNTQFSLKIQSMNKTVT
jgi:hypothetical protein